MAGIFISHSSHDKPFVHKLGIDLVNDGIPVWFDAWEIELGDSLVEKINAGIDESTYFIAVVSPASVESGWVDRELTEALSKEDQSGRKFIVPIKVGECHFPDKVAGRLYADFSESYMGPLEKLIRYLKNLGLHRISIHPEHELVPLTFTKGVYLQEEPLERRIRALQPRLPKDFRLQPNQFVVAPDAEYDRLRDRLTFRMENIVDDPYYSAEFETDFANRYRSILDDEDALIEGICLILNELALARQESICSFEEACHWFARIERGRTLFRLWLDQNPDLPDRSEYGKEYQAAELGNSMAAAEFYAVSEVHSCAIGPHIGDWINMATSFPVFVDNDAKFVKNLVGEDQLLSRKLLSACQPKDFSKFIIPQMVHKFVHGNRIPVSWDFEDYVIGIA